jgi:hypothetical protein
VQPEACLFPVVDVLQTLAAGRAHRYVVALLCTGKKGPRVGAFPVVAIKQARVAFKGIATKPSIGGCAYLFSPAYVVGLM